MTAGENVWAQQNQTYLMAAVHRVRECLDGGEEPEPESQADPAGGEPFALDILCRAFSLSGFERSVLLMCAGLELDSSFGGLFGGGRSGPSFSLALGSLPEAHWSAVSPASPLRRWQLIHLGSGDVVTECPLRIDERVLHFLAGVWAVDESLRPFLRPVEEEIALAESQLVVGQRIRAAWRSSANPGEPVAQLVGAATSAKRGVAAWASRESGMNLHRVRASDVVSFGPAEREQFLNLWARESVLSRSALLIEADDLEAVELKRLAAITDDLAGWGLVSTREPLRLPRASVCFEVDRPRPEEQASLWRSLLGELGNSLNGDVNTLVGHFSLDVGGIESAAAAVAAEMDVAQDPGRSPGRILWDACREQARSPLEGLAQRLHPSAAWDDLILPDTQKEQLREIAGQVRHRRLVYGRWGFDRSTIRGLGISALFAGPSGTGKTMAAEVIAGELGLDLYRIDLSQVVSKYIGETEKNLRAVFDAAEGAGAILLFDEADALFGKRTEVKDSHDRYSNVEVSYLLQRMEEYRGLAILTTNLKSALDHAFLRRLRFVVSFPFPEEPERRRIWQRVFPASAPLDGVDPLVLGRLGVTGGNIRNIALHAAFLAAERAEPIQMDHLLRAARAEYAKLERTLTGAELGGWT